MKVFLLCMTAVLTVYLVVDFFEKLRNFLRNDAELVVMLTFFLYRMPDISFQLAPLAALMATILTLGFLNKNQEITAMRSCGMSFFQIATPFLVFGIVASTILFSFTAVLVPFSNKQAEYIKNVVIQKKPQALTLGRDGLWLRFGQNALLKIDAVKEEGSFLQKLRLYRMGEDFDLTEIIEAENARYGSQGWILESAGRRQLSRNGRITATQHAQLALELPLTPTDFQTWMSVKPKNMTLQQLGDYIERLARDGHKNDRLLTDYWGRMAFSTVTFVMTLIGVSLSFRGTGTRGMTVARGIGQALGIGFLFWAIHSIGIVLGRNGALLPIVSGWFAVVMFFILGLNMFLRVR
jgi:lipopolysaccharide export system permease protein